MKKTSKLLLTSVLTIAMCISLIAGATFALFTSDDSVNIAVSSGKVEVKASIGDILTYSYVEQLDGSYAQETVGRTDGSFEVGGEAHKTDSGIVINNIVPGDKVEFNIIIENNSNVTVKYQTSVSLGKITVDGKEMESHEGLLNALKIKVEDEELVASGLSGAKYSNWDTLPAGTTPIAVVVELPYDYDDNSNDADSIQGKMCAIDFNVRAVQGNAQTYDPTEANPEFTGPAINNASELTAFSKMVNSGDYTLDQAYLTADIDLGGVDSWEPIGTTTNKFSGTFDGNGYTISNVKINAENASAETPIGLFGATENATITNLTVEGTVTGNVKVLPQGTLPQTVIGGVAGLVYGKTDINNCTSNINMNITADGTNPYSDAIYVGGIVGYVNNIFDSQNPDTFTLENCLFAGNINITGNGNAIVSAGGMVSLVIGDVWWYRAYKSMKNLVSAGTVTVTNNAGEGACGGIAGLVMGVYDQLLQDANTWYSIGMSTCGSVVDLNAESAIIELGHSNLTGIESEFADLLGEEGSVWTMGKNYPVLK